MFLRHINEKQLQEVIKLEREISGGNMQFTEEEYLTMLNNKDNCSFGVYSNKELVGFIIANGDKNKEKEKKTYYKRKRDLIVKHMACKTKRALFILMLMFPYKVKESGNYKGIKFAVNEKLYKLCLKIEEQINPVITKIDAQFNKKTRLYDLYVDLCIRTDQKYPYDIKYRIMVQIYEGTKECANLRKIFYDLLLDGRWEEKRSFCIDSIVSHKNMMLRRINEKNLEFLNTLGREYNVLVVYEKTLFGKKPKKFKESLEKTGYKGRIIDDSTNYWKQFDSLEDARQLHETYGFIKDERSNDRINIRWYRHITLDDKYYDNTITFFRHILKKHIIEYYKEKQSNATEMYVYDKYGDKVFELYADGNVYEAIPRVYSNLFDSYVNKHKFCTKIIEMGINEYDFDEYTAKDSFMFKGLIKIRKFIGEKEALDFFHRVSQKAREASQKCEGDLNRKKHEMIQTIHDWYYPIDELFNNFSRQILTEGAYRVILTKSLNQINKINAKIKSLMVENKKDIDIDYLRKTISKNIRKDLSIDEIVNEAVFNAETKWLKRKKISVKLHKKLNEFIERMRRYNDNINIPTLFNTFGNKTIDMIKGNSLGLFEETYYDMDRSEIGVFAKKCLGNRGKNALAKNPFKLFTALNKIQNVQDIIAGNIPAENVEKILNEVYQRNIEVPRELFQLDKLYAKIERKCSPEFLIAGDASVCCMSFGESNAKTYALEKGFGIFNVYYKDRIIGNSVLWINEEYNCLVLDNVEIHLNYTRFNDQITKLYIKMVEDIINRYDLDFAVQGAGYNDLMLYSQDARALRFEEIKPVDVNKTNFYTDAYNVYLVAINKQKIINNNVYKLLKQLKNSNPDINYDVFSLAI
ncbi:hypothetical protein [Alkaliphilus sp. B6464]|uniref:hypothetical protein n=1 Tax=Alkaliphilus sp. B6464 TaxID=2731219 RepID=UPI001BACA7AE|nr:hypothetical protein [Alkaliphilus sp. B6464]QUH22110.1 hypothetical protein HYG84_19580 [Alkaliphilus sp. B6464]